MFLNLWVLISALEVELDTLSVSFWNLVLDVRVWGTILTNIVESNPEKLNRQNSPTTKLITIEWPVGFPNLPPLD